MPDLYLKETTKDDATHQFNSGFDFKGITLINHSDKSIVLTKDMGTLSKINQPKIVDLSGLVGNTEILFEFSDDGERWAEGYLYNIDSNSKHSFCRALKFNGEMKGRSFYKFLRLQTDRWHFHDGKSGCPLPEGICFEAQCTRIVNGSTNIHSDNNKRDRQCWIHAPHLVKVIAYRPTGLLDGWVMPGGE